MSGTEEDPVTPVLHTSQSSRPRVHKNLTHAEIKEEIEQLNGLAVNTSPSKND